MTRSIVAVTAVLLFAGASVLVSPSVADDVEVVRIGFAAPLTGPSASDGKEMENSARLAIEDANRLSPMLANRPVRFELSAQDDQGDPRIASQIAQRFSDMSVAGVVGHFNSSCSIAASDVYESASIAEVSPSSTSPAYTSRGYKTTFRVVGQDRVAGSVLAHYVVETLHAQRIAIIDDRTAFGEGLADTVNDAIGSSHGQVVGREYVTDKTVDFSAVLTRIRSQNVDVVVFGGFDAQAAQLVRRMRSLQMNAKLVGEGFNNEIFLKLAHGDGEGTVTIQPGLPMDKLPANDFSRRYEDSFKQKLEGFQGPYAYDATMVLVHAVLESQSTAPGNVLGAVRRTHMVGITGPLAFDKNGDLSGAPYTVYRLDGNEWNVVKIIAGE
jgi:branched-chain amino acid transport system substrate-binding protein